MLIEKRVMMVSAVCTMIAIDFFMAILIATATYFVNTIAITFALAFTIAIVILVAIAFAIVILAADRLLPFNLFSTSFLSFPLPVSPYFQPVSHLSTIPPPFLADGFYDPF